MEIKPKKSLGQNFLKDSNIIKQIVDVGNISEDNTVIEVTQYRVDITCDGRHAEVEFSKNWNNRIDAEDIAIQDISLIVNSNTTPLQRYFNQVKALWRKEKNNSCKN